MSTGGKKIDTRDLVSKIERLTRERMVKSDVISMQELRRVRSKATPYSLLVVEDDETIRSGLRRLFEQEGYRVITAADGTQLSSVLDDNPIDLILLDVGLPWINGYELATMMKDHRDLREIPLVFLSGRSSMADMKRGFEVGADDYITKPFDIENVKKTVKTLIGLAQ